MRLLLDTHAFLWWCEANPRLTDRVYGLLSDPETELLLSLAGAWEIVAKVQAGKLRLPEPAASYIPSRMAHYAINVLPVTLPHILAIEALPQLHKDPFDRLLIAQARIEALPIVTSDPQIQQYGVDTIW